MGSIDWETKIKVYRGRGWINILGDSKGHQAINNIHPSLLDGNHTHRSLRLKRHPCMIYIPGLTSSLYSMDYSYYLKCERGGSHNLTKRAQFVCQFYIFIYLTQGVCKKSCYRMNVIVMLSVLNTSPSLRIDDVI